ncbi:MAG: transposase [Oscillospiraceae bacterium]|nr:transposase [Oscillospiraceae bacterium]
MIKRLESHYTPKHGSWLNIAEIELNILSRQCLSRRLPSIDIVRAQLAAWESERNANRDIVNWHFSNTNARIKLVSLYPLLL